MSFLDKFFDKSGKLKDFTPLNASEKTKHYKRVKNRFKVSYNLSKTDGKRWKFVALRMEQKMHSFRSAANGGE